MNYKSTLAAAVLGAGVVLASSFAGYSASTDAPTPVPSQKLWEQKTPCAYEDSVNCYWNAGEMGNGHGHSFVVRWMPGPKGERLVCVLYNERKFARHHDYCS